MRPLVSVTSRVAVLDRADVDTDQIIPKQFLKRIERTGFGQFAFYDWRFDADGMERAGFERPDGFTHQVVFRRCVSCQQVKVVREDDFVCVFCDEALPSGWNIDQEGCRAVTSTDDFRRSRRSTSSGWG